MQSLITDLHGVCSVGGLLGGRDAEVQRLGRCRFWISRSVACGRAEAASGCPEPPAGTKGLAVTWEMVFSPLQKCRGLSVLGTGSDGVTANLDLTFFHQMYE